MSRIIHRCSRARACVCVIPSVKYSNHGRIRSILHKAREEMKKKESESCSLSPLWVKENVYKITSKKRYSRLFLPYLESDQWIPKRNSDRMTTLLEEIRALVDGHEWTIRISRRRIRQNETCNSSEWNRERPEGSVRVTIGPTSPIIKTKNVNKR